MNSAARATSPMALPERGFRVLVGRKSTILPALTERPVDPDPSDPAPDAVLNTTFVVCVLNFFLFLVLSSVLGGDALAGKIHDGHYFLNSHGTFKEVSLFAYQYSKLHTASLFVTQPVALICGILIVLREMERNR
jgi:hypothetical protein